MIQKDKDKVRATILHALKSAAAEIVYIDVSDVALSIGMDKVEELVGDLVQTDERKSVTGSKRRQAVRTGIGAFNRLELLQAFAPTEEEVPNHKEMLAGALMPTNFDDDLPDPTPRKQAAIETVVDESTEAAEARVEEAMSPPPNHITSFTSTTSTKPAPKQPTPHTASPQSSPKQPTPHTSAPSKPSAAPSSNDKD